MKNKEFFYKKFSVGLTLDASIFEFETFLNKYSKYISNFYFSLPLGDKFHARENVVKQMKDPYKVNLLWTMLKMIRSFDIKLELVLNNGNVFEDDIIAAKKMLEENEISIDLLGITSDIYANVKKYFPTKELVYSFKNHTHTQNDFNCLNGHYDEIVLGRQNIRNYDLFAYIKEQLKSKVVLLINNGCSHICGGCTTLENCHSSYYRAKLNYSPEYLYALQSIMPYEIHENLLDLSNVDLLKISSRNASLKYLSDCMNSYINCIEDSYINKSINNYLLWGRLAWHFEYYDEFSLKRIRDYKAAIYAKQNITKLNKKINLCLDLRDKFFVGESEFSFEEKRIKTIIDKESRGLPYSLDECIIGVSNCRKMFVNISLERLNMLINKIKLTFKKIYFEIPKLQPKDYIILDKMLTTMLYDKIDAIVVNDWDTFNYISNNYPLALAIGEELSFSNIYSPTNNYECENDERFGVNLVSEILRKKISETGNVKFMVCDMSAGGMCISKNEKMPIFINLLHRTIAYDVCNFKEGPACNMPCLNTQNGFIKHLINNKPWFSHCNSVRETITDYSSIIKTIYENRATFILKV